MHITDNTEIAASNRNMFRDGRVKSSYRIHIPKTGDYLTSASVPITPLVANTDATLDLTIGDLVDYAVSTLPNSKLPCKIPARRRGI